MSAAELALELAILELRSRPEVASRLLTRDELEQEARLILLEERPRNVRLAHLIVRQRLVDRVRRETRRRPMFVELVDDERSTSDEARIEARAELERIRQVELPPAERHALALALRGEPCPKPTLATALYRARRRLRGA